MGIELIFKAILTVASIAYQQKQRKKMKAAMAAQQDAMKGMKVTKRYEIHPLPVVYGKAAIGGISSRTLVSYNSKYGDLSAVDKHFAYKYNNVNQSNEAPSYLHTSYALCHGGIEGIQWVKVDGTDYDDSKAKFWHSIRTYNDGGDVDQIMANSSTSATTPKDTSKDFFTDCAHASATFLLNRDDPNYSGLPNLEFLVKGRKVRFITESGGVYTLSSNYEYSNNPAYVLLDYLLNDKFGAKLDVSEIDLESFYHAAQVCDIIVADDYNIGGMINGQRRINTVASYATLPGDLEARTYENDVWYTSDTGKYYIWNKTAWIETQYSPQTSSYPVLKEKPVFKSTGSFLGVFKWAVDQLYYQASQTRSWQEFDGARFNTSNSSINDFYTVTQVASEASLPVLADQDFPTQLYQTLNNNKYWQWLPQITSTPVQIDAPKDIIRLYECNVVLDSSAPVRDNIEVILNSMGMAELSWTTSGKYKLSLEYPATDAAQEALVTNTFNEDNIIRDSIELNWGNADSRLNQATVRFFNEKEDFKEDSVTWPETGSAVHITYLEEDNYKPYATDVSGDGITSIYHAKAKAEQMVRMSRSMYTVSFTADRSALNVEVSDFIKVTIPSMGISNEILRVEYIKVNEDFTVEIKAYKFDKDMLAWSVDDDVAYEQRSSNDYEVPAPTNGSYLHGSATNNKYSIGRLSWDAPTTIGAFTYEVYYKLYTDTSYKFLATTNNEFIDFETLEVPDLSLVDFAVYAKTPLGTKSDPLEINDVNVKMSPDDITSLNITEEQYLTNNASGLKTRAMLEWTFPSSGVTPGYFLVEYKLAADANYETVGTTSASSITINDIKDGLYDFRVTPYSFNNYAGNGTVFQKSIVGYSGNPADPVGFAGNVNEGQINLSWALPTDIDVLYGGYSQIRYHPATDGTASWDTASILVGSLAGNTNNKAVPTMRGTFLIKFSDAFGNQSVNSAEFVSLFIDSSFNQVEVVDEHAAGFLGTKTNCSVNGLGNLELTTGQTNLVYEFDDYIDLGEVTTVRLVPAVTALVTELSATVASYTNISLVQNMAGPLKNAAIRVYVSTTDDDPAGSPTWSAWALLTVSSYVTRAAKFKLEITTEDTNTAVEVTGLTLTVDKKDVIKVGTSTSSTSADTTVTFATPFYGGPSGTNSPTIGIAIINATAGDDVVVTSRDKTGFTYSIYNGGSRVQRDIDYQAIGQ